MRRKAPSVLAQIIYSCDVSKSKISFAALRTVEIVHSLPRQNVTQLINILGAEEVEEGGGQAMTRTKCVLARRPADDNVLRKNEGPSLSLAY